MSGVSGVSCGRLLLWRRSVLCGRLCGRRFRRGRGRLRLGRGRSRLGVATAGSTAPLQ